MPVFLGIDIGTSGTKTLAINESGKILASATEEYPLSRSRNIIRRAVQRLSCSSPTAARVDPDDPAIGALRGSMSEMHDDLTRRLGTLAERIDALERGQPSI